MADGLGGLTDRRRVVGLVTRYLSNALFLLLDLPLTRLPAKEFATRIGLAHGHGFDKWDLHDEATRDRFADFLRMRADTARDCGVPALAGLIDWAAEAVASLDLGALDKYAGQRQYSVGPCGRCSMWFASEVMSCIDTRCDFFDWSGTGLIYLPAGINVSVCPFCGLAEQVEQPAMFYAPQRNQVVYCLPTRGFMTQDEAVEAYRPVIGSLRADYTASLNNAELTKFESAIELTTWDLPEFLYAIQMGETIEEGHVFTIMPLPDGGGLLFDGSKGFARVMTPREVEWYRARGMVQSIEPIDFERLQESDDRLRGWLDHNPDDEFARNQEEMIARLLTMGVEAIGVYAETRPDDSGWRPAPGSVS